MFRIPHIKHISMLSYLHRNFPPYNWIDSSKIIYESNKWNDQLLKDKIFKDLGVNTKIEGILYQFKYEVCVVREWTVEVDDCRGLIVSRNSEEKRWDIASIPFSKFFNREEKQCIYSSKQLFEQDLNQFSLTEKADGTCIQLWYGSFK